MDIEFGEDGGPHFTGGETEAQRDVLRLDKEWRLAEAKASPLALGAGGCGGPGTAGGARHSSLRAGVCGSSS